MNIKKSTLYIIIIAAMLLLVSVLLYVGLFQKEQTAAVILPEDSQNVQNGEAEDSTQTLGDKIIEITPQTVAYAVKGLSRPEIYSRALTVTRFWSGGQQKSTIEVYVSGSETKAVIDGKKHILISGDELSIWYTGDTEVFTGKASENDDDEFQSIPTYEDILELSPDDILDAGYIPYNGENCIYVVYIYGQMNYTVTVHISVSTGLLTACNIYDGDSLIYTAISGDLSTAAPDYENFKLPP